MKRLIAVILLLSVIVSGVSFAANANTGSSWEKFEMESIREKGNPKMSYWVYVPDNYHPGMAMVVYLHSTSGMTKYATNEALPAYVKNGIVENPDAIIVVPQLVGDKDRDYWDTAAGTVNRITKHVIEEYEIDESRVALTGWSLGGIGVWDIAEAAPGLYKRILSLCGRVKGTKSAESFVGSEIRIYTVPDDKNVKSTSAIQFMEPLHEAGVSVTHTEIDSTHSKVPIQVYGDPEVQEWLWLIAEGTGKYNKITTGEVLQTAENQEWTESGDLTEEWKLKSRNVSFNKVVTIKDKNFVLYAQNSPEYCDIQAGKSGSCTVGGSMCSAFALANVLINVVNYDDLEILKNIARSPIKIDTKSVMIGKGVREKDSFELTRNEDIFRYFPLALINIIGGNNVGFGNGLGNTGSYKLFFQRMGIRFEKTKETKDCVEAVKNDGAMAVICTGSAASPIANQYGHYFVMAYVDGDRVYFLDSIMKNTYELDKYGIIYVQEPGVFWVDRENLKKLCLYGTKFIVYPNEDHTVYTQEDYDAYINLSNTNVNN